MKITLMDGIRYLVIDVDGTMTDSGIYYDNNGNELKKFCTRDAAAFFAAHQVGIEVIVLTGRECEATTKRMRELGVEHLYQNVKDKACFLQAFMKDYCITKNEIGYIGDDLNDILPMRMCGFVACPSDACKEIIALADYVSSIRGGCGAVRDIIEFILTQRGEWDKAVSAVYGVGT